MVDVQRSEMEAGRNLEERRMLGRVTAAGD